MDFGMLSVSGTIFRLKGAILAMSFLDCNGVLIPAITDPWTDSGKDQAQGRGAEKKYNSKLDSKLHNFYYLHNTAAMLTAD